jgi:hypothetical protein
MGYWKREYTERKTNRPLFRSETADEIAKDQPAPDPDDESVGDGETDRLVRPPAYTPDS